ncbi:MAG: hypothetical protein Q8R26_03895 [bacterium]|nr:hypothetical protein [bacterium]
MDTQFKYIIDKEANFAYWAQLMLGKWDWYFEKERVELFKKMSGEFSPEEQNALNQFRLILQKEGNQRLWLWQRYAGSEIENNIEREIYFSIRKILDQKFELIWRQEFLLLQQWERLLSSFDIKELETPIQQAMTFLGGSNKVGIFSVKLFIGSETPTGATQPLVLNLLMLNISHTPANKINKAIGVIIHEFLHLVNNRNGLLKDLMKQAFMQELKTQYDTKLKDGYKWKYLFIETILRSIASGRSNTYIGEFLEYDDATKKIDADLSHKKPLIEIGYAFMIRIAASKMLEETKSYLSLGKIIDLAYIKKVVEIWKWLLYEQNR